jgi:hypothetical protein
MGASVVEKLKLPVVENERQSLMSDAQLSRGKDNSTMFFNNL